MVGGLSLLESNDQLVVALDFDTTFSGIAYAIANDKKPDILLWTGLVNNTIDSIMFPTMEKEEKVRKRRIRKISLPTTRRHWSWIQNLKEQLLQAF